MTAKEPLNSLSIDSNRLSRFTLFSNPGITE
jgi:hypothetical protein